MQRNDPRRATVFLVVHGGFAARYLLRSDVLTTLLDAGVRTVVLAPNHDEEYFRQELEGLGAIVEPLRAAAPPPAPGAARDVRQILRSMIARVRRFGLSGQDSPAFLDRYQGSSDRFGASTPVWVSRPVDILIRRVMWRSRSARRALLALELRVDRSEAHADHFQRYRPDLVVTTGPGYARADQLLLNEARRRGVRTAATILGWDNPTSKGYRGADPDLVIAWSERMAQQLERFQDIPRGRIRIGGVPHFDPYHRVAGLLSWAELCAAQELDPDRRLLVYATSTPGEYPHNALIANTLARAVEDGSLGDVQLVVRLHPVFLRTNAHAVRASYQELVAAYPHVHLNVPEIRSHRLRLDMSAMDTLVLGSLVRHGAVLVNLFSTTTLEAFITDTPVVMVAPDAHCSSGAPGEGEIGRAWEQFTHLRPLVASEAARIAHSMEELLHHVGVYLNDPSLDRAQRALVAREETGPADGESGRRVARLLLEELSV